MKLYFFSILFFFLSVSLLGKEIPMEFYKRQRLSQYELTPYILFIDTQKQEMAVFKNNIYFKSYVISTAKRGEGQEIDSQKTPMGLHRIFQKIGGEAPINTIFIGRKNTGKVWDDQFSERGKDFILTRILRLEGLEEGINRGQDCQGKIVDTLQRMIYIHGTNQEDMLGKPSSMGCIRMEKNDVRELFSEAPEGSLVWIGS